jgi:hypothetical protein
VFFFALRQKSSCHARRQIPGRFALVVSFKNTVTNRGSPQRHGGHGEKLLFVGRYRQTKGFARKKIKKETDLKCVMSKPMFGQLKKGESMKAEWIHGNYRTSARGKIGYWAICPEIPGANGQGETIEETKNSLRQSAKSVDPGLCVFWILYLSPKGAFYEI